MAEVPARVEARFVTKEVNSAGIYLMKLYVNGIESPVVVDDYLPSKYEQPAFASSGPNELWVCLLEKAWAKLHGSYMRTEGGLPTMAASHLLGVPSYDITHEKIDVD